MGTNQNGEMKKAGGHIPNDLEDAYEGSYVEEYKQFSQLPQVSVVYID